MIANSLAAGDKAPAFKTPGDDGRELSLASFKGKKLVLYFYPKDDTTGCTKEAIDFNGLRTSFEKTNTIVVGISPDSCASHVKFKTKHTLAMPLLADETRVMLEAYGVWKEKSMYGRKYMGVERTTLLIGPDGRIARVWTKVKVPGHADEVLAAAQDL